MWRALQRAAVNFSSPSPSQNETQRVALQKPIRQLAQYVQLPKILGLVNDAHSAATQLSHDAVMRDGPADQRIGAVLFALPAREGTGGHLYRRTLQETSCLFPRGTQAADFSLQRFVARARVPQKRIAFHGRTLQRRLQQVIDLFPPFRIHRLPRRSIRSPFAAQRTLAYSALS